MDMEAALRTVASIKVPYNSSIGWEVRALLDPFNFRGGVRLTTLIDMIVDKFGIVDFQARQVVFVLMQSGLLDFDGWYISRGRLR